MDKDKYMIYAKCYYAKHKKSCAETNDSNIKEYAERFLKARINSVATKITKQKNPLIKHNLLRLYQNLIDDRDELQKGGNFNV
jgi:hypothetical protein